MHFFKCQIAKYRDNYGLDIRRTLGGRKKCEKLFFLAGPTRGGTAISDESLAIGTEYGVMQIGGIKDF